MSLDVGYNGVTTNESMIWMKKPEKPKKQIVKRSVKGNSIFFDCSLEIDDPYWIGKLLDAHKGKFPAGIRFKDGRLMYRKGNKKDSIFLSEDVKVALKQTIKFFSDHGVKVSALDIKNQRDDLNKQLSKVMHINSWKETLNNKIKERLIYDYAIRKTKELGLKEWQRKNIIGTIYIGIITGRINAEDIEFEKDRIKNISVLKFNGRIFSIGRKVSLNPPKNINNFDRCDKEFTPPSVFDKPNIDYIWEKKKNYIFNKHIDDKHKVSKIDCSNKVIKVPKKVCKLVIE